MKKTKLKKLLANAMLYTVCWRNVDRLCDIWRYERYNTKLKKRKEDEIMDKTKRNELLTTLADINNIIEKIERKVEHEEATDITNQLLYAYDIKVKLLNNI